jgi:flagellar L-ring protein precursor FlgH
MRTPLPRFIGRLAVVAAVAVTAGGCTMLTRLAEVGDGPKTTPIVNPMARPDYKPVSMPMPAPKPVDANPNSLWRAGARAFFKDQRAKEVGDILTVKLNLTDKAIFKNKTERTRDDSEDTNVTSLLGLEAEFAKKLPQAISPSSLMSFDNDHTTKGDGTIDRNETVQITMAAVVTQVLPNGNLVVAGRQEMKVNYEMRELAMMGVIRPEDIDYTNAISHEKIAEMRVAYGGRGTLSDLQAPRWGTQLWDIIFPF